MIHRIFLILILLILLPDWYICRQFIRPSTPKSRFRKSLLFIPSAILLICLTLLMFGDNFTSERILLTGYFFLVCLPIMVPKCLFTLCSLMGKLAATIIRRSGAAELWTNRTKQAFNMAGVTLALAGVGIILYGETLGWRYPEVKTVEFRHTELPEAFDGYRIVQLSDFHLGTIARYPTVIEQMVSQVNAQEADLIVFTGDLVNNEATELDGLEPILTRLKAHDGVCSILGNHDYGLYRKWETPEMAEANLEQLKEKQRTMGWHLLLNENRLIRRDSACIAIVGVENDGLPPFPSRGDLPKATRGTEGLFALLLSHDPSHWRRSVLPDTDIPLTLSGHTHAMQFRLGGFSPSVWFYPEWGGMYTEGGQSLYVNAGIGSVMFPFRFGAWPEITVITLKKK